MKVLPTFMPEYPLTWVLKPAEDIDSASNVRL